MAIGDFNHDGYGDLAMSDAGGTGVYKDRGIIYIHYGSNSFFHASYDTRIIGSIPLVAFGDALSVGDINGDGIDDLIVGVPGDEAGRVDVYYGDTLGLHTIPSVILHGRVEGGYYEDFGVALASGVDYNQDGYDDILIGAYNNCGHGIQCGKAYCYYGGNPMDTIPDWWYYGESAGQSIAAYNISCVDVDTVGFEPCAWFGTPNWPNGNFGNGKCYMFTGDNMGEAIPAWTVSCFDINDSSLGYWSCSAGYADDDRLGDFLASSLNIFSDPGKVYLWLRRPIMHMQPDAWIEGRQGCPAVTRLVPA